MHTFCRADPQCYIVVSNLLSFFYFYHPGSAAYQAPRIYKPGRGAPKFDIKKEQLELLISVNMSAPKIAKLLGTSESTVKRRLRFVIF